MIASCTRRVYTLLFLVVLVLSGCVGYTPPVIPETESLPSPPVSRPPRTATATTLPKTSTARPSPAVTLGLKAGEVKGETIRFWHTRGASEVDGLLALVEEFNRSNPWNIRVETTAFERSAAIVEKIQKSIYGELPDLAVVYPFQTAQLNASGSLLVDLSPYLHDRDWGFTSAEIQDFTAQFWEQDILQEKRLGIPFYRLAQVFYYNETWAGELGFVNPPQSTQEFKRQVCIAAEVVQAEKGRGDGAGGWAISSDAATLAGWIYAFGGEFFSQDKKVYQFDTPETRQAFVFLRGLMDDGCAWKPESSPPWVEFAARKALVIAASTGGFSAQSAAMENDSRNDRWTVIPFPSPEGQPAIVVYGPSLVILRSTPERQLAAWLFLKWLVKPENQANLVKHTGFLPVRISALSLLEEYGRAHPQWASTIKLLSYAHVEPAFASWRTVRLVLSDAGGELFSPAFHAEAISELIGTLQDTADEIHMQFR